MLCSRPHELNALCFQNPALLYDLLFKTSAATLLEIAADPKHLGAQIGFLSILHTWGQNLLLHPHVHCVIPAGGLSPDHTKWVHPRYVFFLPVIVLGRVFGGKFIDGLRRAFQSRKPRLGASLEAFQDARRFADFLHTLFRQDWVVYAKPAFGDPTRVLRYLGRYTHRVAISNHRLLNFDGERVTFRWKDYAHGNKQRKMTLTGTEFLRRFVQHILPQDFVRIRHFGFLANRCRAKLVTLGRRLLAMTPPEHASAASATPAQSSWTCPHCGATMQIEEKLTAWQLALRCNFFDTS